MRFSRKVNFATDLLVGAYHQVAPTGGNAGKQRLIGRVRFQRLRRGLGRDFGTLHRRQQGGGVVYVAPSKSVHFTTAWHPGGRLDPEGAMKRISSPADAGAKQLFSQMREPAFGDLLNTGGTRYGVAGGTGYGCPEKGLSGQPGRFLPLLPRVGSFLAQPLA